MIQITCKGRSAALTSTALLTSGTVGERCQFDFDAAWNDLTKTAVFEGGGVSRDVLLEGSECVVPHEVLAKPGCTLYIGVYGADVNDNLVIPTVYVNAGAIYRGADPSGDPSTDPTLPVYEDLRRRIEQLSPGGSSIARVDGNTLVIEEG